MLASRIERWLDCRLVVSLEDEEWGTEELLHTGAATDWACQVVGRLASLRSSLQLGVAAQLAEQSWQVRVLPSNGRSYPPPTFPGGCSSAPVLSVE